MRVKQILSKYKNQEGYLCITDNESDLYINRMDARAVEFECGEWLLNSEVVELRNNTKAISGSKEVEIALEITIGNWDVVGEYDVD